MKPTEPQTDSTMVTNGANFSGTTSKSGSGVGRYNGNPFDRITSNKDIVDNVKRLKLSLLNAATGVDSSMSVLFTSAEPEAGTSTIMLNFAMALAAGGAEVILVDANTKHPDIHRALDLDMQNGLMDMTGNEGSLSAIVKQTGIRNLSAVTLGTTMDSNNPYVEINPEPLQVLISTLKKNADYVLFDSPPLTSNSDIGLTLANIVDSIVLVVQAEKTRWRVVQHAVSSLEHVRQKIAGTVLNRRNVYVPKWLYDRI